MKFSCDRCDAQYMISDEKVGPNGVKVRCKKCSNVILVRRVAENGAAAAERPAATPAPAPVPASGTGEHSLERELGHAFDHAFGDTPAEGSRAPAETGLDTTQAVSPEEAAQLAAASAGAPTAAPAASEWYVAIGQAQVGPLPLVEVKRKWEGGDVGPESLVWRPGMGDWAPLSSVSDLAAYLSPISRTPRPAARAPEPAAPSAAAAAPRSEPAAPVPAADVTWKPVGASALAALASEEIASRGTPEPTPEKKPLPSGVRSLVDELPDGGGVDPTGALPLPIKALEKTDEQKLERRSSVARGAEQLRHKRSVARAVAVTAVVVIAVVGAGAGGTVYYLNRKVPSAQAPAPAPAPVAVAPAPSTPPAPVPAAAPAPAVAVAAAPQPEPARVAETPPAPAPAKAEAQPPAPEPEKAAAAEKVPPARAKVSRAEPPARAKRELLPRKEREPVRVAQAAPPPDPAPAPTPKKKKDSLLDFDSNDSALDEALGSGGKPGRSVYVPPAPGGGGVPASVTDSQVNETILGRVASLQQCVQEQQGRGEGGGTLKMRWSISPDGSVQSVKCVTPEYATSPLAQCLTGLFKSLRFPKSSSGRQDVTFPIKF